MKLFLVSLTFFISTHLWAGDTKIRKAIEDGLVTKAFIDTLTNEDVPEKWKIRKKEEIADKSRKIIYFRGDRKALEVMWAKEWTGKREKMFVATIYDGDFAITKIAYISDSSAVYPVKEGSGYEQIISLKDTGVMTVALTHEKGYFESVEILGRKTHLMDDLEYTKTALALENIVFPLMDTIKESLEKPGNKPRKSNQTVEPTR